MGGERSGGQTEGRENQEIIGHKKHKTRRFSHSQAVKYCGHDQIYQDPQDEVGLGVGCVRCGGVKNRSAFENTLHLSSQVSAF